MSVITTSVPGSLPLLVVLTVNFRVSPGRTPSARVSLTKVLVVEGKSGWIVEMEVTEAPTIEEAGAGHQEPAQVHGGQVVARGLLDDVQAVEEGEVAQRLGVELVEHHHRPGGVDRARVEVAQVDGRDAAHPVSAGPVLLHDGGD